MPAQEIAILDPADELVFFPAVVDCCIETCVPDACVPALVVTPECVEVKGIVVVALTTNPPSAKLIVSPSTT